MNKFPNYIQADSKDCGPTCLKIIAKFYRKKLNIQKLRELCETTREGSTLFSISNAAEQVGFRTMGIKISLLDLKEAPLPCILFWNKNHFVVLYKVKKGKYYISDPAFGLLEYTEQEVLNYWIGNNATIIYRRGDCFITRTHTSFL
ncbi:ABC-type bacteriocin/lantibiotic exporter with double-glycine peptidase domain [Myroides gitamensis]|nr:ABC-type bacteriocin/lantibiotic exporter with double-glycine peptidase domain [Myroides gitamensis]